MMMFSIIIIIIDIIASMVSLISIMIVTILTINQSINQTSSSYRHDLRHQLQSIRDSLVSGDSSASWSAASVAPTTDTDVKRRPDPAVLRINFRDLTPKKSIVLSVSFWLTDVVATLADRVCF